MNKCTLLFLLVTFILSCNTSKIIVPEQVLESESYISNEMNVFLLGFEKSVINHSKKEMIKFIDVDYKSEQLNNLEGNMIQFIDEMFCGNRVDDGSFECVKLKQVKGIKLSEMVKEAENSFIATYLVITSELELYVNWNINISSSNPFSGYGFVGAYG